DVLFGLGPYFSYGVGGKINLNINSASADINYTEDIRWSKYDGFLAEGGERIIYEYQYSQMKRFDYGATLKFGVRYKSIILSAKYNYGLANLMWEYRKYQKINNHNFDLSISYMFDFTTNPDTL
ncbi:MAG: outer membrane beta-barrel protein, partial [Bacteroidales bacterium]|nr:outer membrane beta-barrel protein [Bacteroidales bacterium]